MEALPHIPESDLIRAASAGDVAAFEALIAPLQRPLYGFAIRLCGDTHLAEDLCQDTLVKGFRGLSGFSGQSSLSTWLYRILRNTWLDHVKKSGRQPLDLRAPEPADDSTWEEPPDMAREAVTRFFATLRRDGVRERVHTAIDALPEPLREVIVLRDLKGFAYDEVAGITGLQLGTVKSRLARARERLRRLLLEADAIPREAVDPDRSARKPAPTR